MILNLNNNYRAFVKKKYNKPIIIIFASVVILIFYWFILPKPLFKTQRSTVLESEDGSLLGAKIAKDGQWRFPPNDTIPNKFSKAVIEFEDQYFYYHLGFNPISLFKALIRNVKAKRIVGGGSTISMQVIRLSRGNPKRSIFEKIWEIFLATRLELSYSKDEILSFYASNAPFGSNVVGVEAASWRYYGKSSDLLSWSEAATLAVLPNSPSLIYPGKNQQRLLDKRNRLLLKLFNRKIIDSTDYLVALAEPLPGNPKKLPQYATHLLDRLYKDGYRGKRIISTINLELQDQAMRIVEYHHNNLKANDVNNIAVLVLDVNNSDVKAYIGNTLSDETSEHGNDVDVIRSPRSTGSILKPFLFAGMLNDGELLPGTLVPDVPTQIGGYIPQNYNKTFDGAVHAKMALARSLNIPAVKMLQKYGLEKFNRLLKRLGMTTITKPVDHYGLSIILGGAEGNLYDLCGIYASMARTLNNYSKNNGLYCKDDFHAPNYIKKKEINAKNKSFLEESSVIKASAIWCTFDAMIEVSRPDEEASWRSYLSSKKVAWKTGTSYGYRDAWAIGCTPNYIVGVWVGNADGEGRPGLTGVSAAAPILFDVIKILPYSGWFSKPYDEMERVSICRQSGHRASNICPVIDSVWVPISGLNTLSCPYHQLIHLDNSGKWRVHADCEQISNIQNIPWFVLPPVQEWYYKSKNPDYKVLPPYRSDCQQFVSNIKAMDVIYPKNLTKIYVPIELSGKIGSTIFEVAHRHPETIIFWHVDGDYVGKTSTFHQMALSPSPGQHTLTLIDANGESISRKFEILKKDN